MTNGYTYYNALVIYMAYLVRRCQLFLIFGQNKEWCGNLDLITP